MLLGALFVALFLCGCDQITKASATKDAPKKSATQGISNGIPVEDSSVSQADTQHNAVTAGEDDASRQRRERARASLGLGAK